ncbi:MAG: AAA family ATPase, partial [Kofleriaceae bacterium]
FMEAAIRDAVRAAPRANVAAAAPYQVPRDARAAAGFLAVSALIAGFAIPMPDREAALVEADPAFAPPGAMVTLRGRNLLRGVSSDQTAAAVPGNVSVFLGEGGASIAMPILAWSSAEARLQLPETAPLGETSLTAFIGTRKLGPVPFTVVDPKDQRFHREDSVALSDDDVAYAKDLLADLKANARADQVEELDAFVAKIEQLLEQAERGEITKEQLLEELQKAEADLNAGAEPDQAEVDRDLSETGKQLQQNELTKELGAAMAKGDLAKAQEELEKLAEKLAKNELTPKQEEQLAKAMEKAAKQFENKQEAKEQEAKAKQQKAEEEVRRLEKEKQEAKTPEEQEKIGRQLDKKKDELKRLQREQEQKQQSAQRESLKRLHRDMKKAAESLSQPDKQSGQQDSPQSEQEKQEARQQASRSLKDAAEETGKVDRDQRKTATQKKVASQMEDLKEAMRRAKARGAKGAKDPFGKQGKQQDFLARARGGTSKGTAWKPGQGQGQGGGRQGQPGSDGGDGSGDPQESSSYGTGTAPLTGDATAKGGATPPTRTSPASYGKGPEQARDDPVVAAQKGFASRGYQDVVRRVQEAGRGRDARREGAGRVPPLRQEVLHPDQAALDGLSHSPRTTFSTRRAATTRPGDVPPAERRDRPMTASAAAALPQDIEATVGTFMTDLHRLRDEIGKMIVGQEEIIEGVLMCLLGGGHALLEGVPGLGKTMLVRTLAETIHASFSRIQFTPDLMPADIVGTNVIVETPLASASAQRGPIFARTSSSPTDQPRHPLKTQSAARGDERGLADGGQDHPLRPWRPFFVLATQNPLEMEGTYPLPEAQLDRFFSRWWSSSRPRAPAHHPSIAPLPRRRPSRARSSRRSASSRCASWCAGCRWRARSRTTPSGCCRRPTPRPRRPPRPRRSTCATAPAARLQAIILAAKIQPRAARRRRYAVAIDDIRRSPRWRCATGSSSTSRARPKASCFGRDHRRDPWVDQGELSGRTPPPAARCRLAPAAACSPPPG